MKPRNSKAVSWLLSSSLALSVACVASSATAEPEQRLAVSAADEQPTSDGSELHGRIMRVDFIEFYSHRTHYFADGTYKLIDSKGWSSSGKWWVEKNGLCFFSIEKKRVCWAYAPLEEGRVYQSFSPYDGTPVHAFLEPVGSTLDEKPDP